MIFKNTDLNAEITVISEGGGYFFDLIALAKALGYTKPRDAIRDFLLRNEELLENAANCGIDPKKADESVVYAFLLKAGMPLGGKKLINYLTFCTI